MQEDRVYRCNAVIAYTAGSELASSALTLAWDIPVATSCRLSTCPNICGMATLHKYISFIRRIQPSIYCYKHMCYYMSICKLLYAVSDQLAYPSVQVHAAHVLYMYRSVPGKHPCNCFGCSKGKRPLPDKRPGNVTQDNTASAHQIYRNTKLKYCNKFTQLMA